MTHFCSLKLTHTKNTTCTWARRGASDIIHAEGVRGVLPSSAPKARNGLSLQEQIACFGETNNHRGRHYRLAQDLPHGKKVRSPGAKASPARCGGGSLLASKVGSFLASAEGTTRNASRDGLAHVRLRAVKQFGDFGNREEIKIS